MRKSVVGVAVTLAVFFSGSVLAQAHTATRHIIHNQHARVVGDHGRAKHTPHQYRHAKPVVALRTGYRQRAVKRPAIQEGDRQSASFDSLAPGALQLMHLSPVSFAGVGAAPQVSPLPHYTFSQAIPTQVQPVDSAQFINASLILAKVADNAPAAALPIIKEAAVEEAPLPAVDTAVPAHSGSTLGVALQMLASQAYYWASHPLATLQENGDFAAGENVRTELRNDVALAAQSMTTEDGTGSSWLSPRGLVSAALRFIGAPYVWGGTSPRTGFDCSGFVKYILAKFDIHVPRTSYAQAASLPAIPRRDLKPGDLVFFNTMHRAFSHVGIYIGHGHFVSAQTPSTGVQVASLSDPYWSARFDGARRLPQDVHFS